MTWETVILNVPGSKKLTRSHKHNRLCPKCEGKLFMIPYHFTGPKGVVSKKIFEDEMEYHVLICDRCGQLMVFEGCTGACASFPKSKCEICGKYYCSQCGIIADIDVDDKHIELRFCNDHVPDWYQNR
jgi:hypothetical protein